MHGATIHHPDDRVALGASASSAWTRAIAVGVIGLLAAVALGALHDGMRRFLFAYLVSFAFFLTLGLGGLFFVMLQHLTRAGWSVNVRRMAEALAATLPAMAALSLPLLISVWAGNGILYHWAQPVDHLDHILSQKRAFLNPAFFTLRIVVYFAVWAGLGWWYWRRSVEQDSTADSMLTRQMETVSAPGVVALAITLTLGAFDLLMSLDAHWYSTMFGVYIFAGAAVAIFASLILLGRGFQARGYLRGTITTEHYHDLGKFLFGFIFFWGYIAFSQYMLIWYANIPEETGWYIRRGATTVSGDQSGWTSVALVLLFGHLLVPFALLMNRRIKRRPRLLVVAACWMLLMHWIDLWWLIMPELDGHVYLGWIEVACFLGIGGILAAVLTRLLTRAALRPINDPRVEESLAFENM